MRISILAAVLALVALAASADVSGLTRVIKDDTAVAEVRVVMTERYELFAVISELVAARPFGVDKVAAITGAEFSGNKTDYTPHFAISSFVFPTDSALFTRIEVRPTAGRNGLIILEVQSQPCISEADVMERFGDSPVLSLPSHHEPPDSPNYFVYRRDWGELRFGFTRDPSECLTTVVLDATGA